MRIYSLAKTALEYRRHLSYTFFHMSVIVDKYRRLKRKHPDRLVLIKTGSVAMFLCEDAEEVSDLLAEPISTSHVIGRPAVVFPQARLAEVLSRLTALGRRFVGVRRRSIDASWEEFSFEKPSDISKIEFAHKVAYEDALDEIKNGRMETSWEWFAFPRLRTPADTDGETGRVLGTLRESRMVLKKKSVSAHIRELAAELLARKESAEDIFGEEAALHVKASATLFALTAKERSDRDLFAEVIKRFFGGKYDAATTAAIAAELCSPRGDTPRDLVKSDAPGGVSVREKNDSPRKTKEPRP